MIEITKPLIILNFKLYSQVLGEKGFQLAKIAEKVSENLGITIAICPPITYLAKYAEILNIPVFAQKVDRIHNGKITGKVSIEIIKDSGASGALINHFDNQLSLTDLETVIRTSRTQRLFTTVCTSNEAISAAVTKLDPHAIAFESPELTGTGISESPDKPEFIQNHVKRIKLENPRVSPICGSGIFTTKDLEIALNLGIEGILLGSTFVKAKEPYELLYGIAKCFIKQP